MLTHHPPIIATRPCGSFALSAGRAMSLRPHHDTVLRITQGYAWVTLPSQPGDHFLLPGDSLHISAKDRVVMEACPMPTPLATTSPSLYFDWDPVPMHQPAPRHAAAHGTWAEQAARHSAHNAVVTQALVDLRAALGLGAGAAVRLTVGLATLTVDAVVRALFTGAARFATIFIAFCARSTLAVGRFTPVD
jgi:Protein of unknown function (DUF2917)